MKTVQELTMSYDDYKNIVIEIVKRDVNVDLKGKVFIGFDKDSESLETIILDELLDDVEYERLGSKYNGNEYYLTTENVLGELYGYHRAIGYADDDNVYIEFTLDKKSSL